ncbi:lanthionine synthetase LanC family protein [Streptomyces sp. NPDC047821]|uniref:lanthionine synthetase LanC family protein n=1 Tax=Streptomyces sp. NPDC047821 TaxID=3365488 RepID=UPI00371889CA
MNSASFLPPDLAARAESLAALVGERLDTPRRAEEHAERAARQTDLPLWNGSSLSEGHAGLALLHLHAGRADTAFRFLRAAFDATAHEPLTRPGLFDGTAGLALVLADCCTAEPRFLPSLHALHERLSRQVLHTAWPRREGGVADHEYDLVYGSAGILVHLSTTPHKNPDILRAVEHCLDHLVWLAEETGEDTPARWMISPERCAAYGGLQSTYPYGYLDTGMSHGAAGMAAALAVAWREGHRRPGHREALDRLTDWLLRVGTAGGRDRQWPRAVPVTAQGREATAEGAEAVPSWCHGTAGVAAALLTVAGATGDRALAAEAFAALDGVLARGGGHGTPTVCHGVAGLAALAHEFAARDSAGAARALPGLVRRLMTAADPVRHPLVFRDRETTGHVVDNPGLLTGAAGVAVTLHALATGHRPTWWNALMPL